MRAETARSAPELPHSIEAEQAVLGSLLIEPTAWAQVAAVIRPEHFHRADHRLIFEAIAELAARNQSPDLVTVADRLQRTKRLEDAGGAAYISTLARDTPTAKNVEAYARVVRDRATIRSLARFGADLERQVADSRGRGADELMAAATRQLLDLQTSARTGKGLVSSQQLAGELIDDLDRRREKRAGLAVGLSDFDELTGGLEPGDLVVIAARPGMGKTSLLVTVASEVSKSAPVAVFSAEMPAQQLMRRCVALLGGVSQTRLRRPDKLTMEDWDTIAPAATALAERRLWIDDTPLPELAHIRAETFALKARAGLGLVLVDYVQLVQGAGANRYEQLRDVAYGFKAVAKDLQAPVIVLAQLNRGVEQRDRDKRPRLSDLRDSGAIEEAADIVGLLYSEGYYDRDFEMPDILECAIEKNRNGERGACLWRFAGERSQVAVLDSLAARDYRQLRSQASSHRRGGGVTDDL